MKTYLLLRDNVETGPYTRECLTQMELRTFDLIWTIDESIVWKYPCEISEFKPFTEHLPVTEATRINTIKERQIRFFREYINDMDFSKYIPVAFTNDIPAGYEYLVMADNYNKYGGSLFVTTEDTTETDAEKYSAPRNEYFILGERQKIDTVEVVADPVSFTSYFTSAGTSKKKWE